MNVSSSLRVAVGLVCTAVFPVVIGSPAIAQTPPPATTAPADKEEATLKPGVLSSQGTFARQGSVDSVANNPAAGDEAGVTPIAGGISKTKDGCYAKITNNSEKSSYSISFRVEGQDKKGTVVMRNSYSASLKPKETVSKRVSCRDDLNMALVLSSGKKTGK